MKASASFTLPGTPPDQVGTWTKQTIRVAFAAIGYKVSLRRSPFSERLLHLYITGNGIEEPLMISEAQCFGTEFYERHIEMFKLCQKVRGRRLANADQKVV